MANPEIQLYTGGQAQVEWGVLSKTTGGMAGALHRGGWNMQLPLSGSSCPGDGKSGAGNECDG